MMWELGDLLIFGSIMAVTWFLFTYNYPRVILYLYKRAILVKGFGEGPIPVNTLQTESQELFADPIHPPRPQTWQPPALTATRLSRSAGLTSKKGR